MKKSGEITVFLSLCMLCVFALLCVMTESARTAGSRFYFQTAVNGALDTLFSHYHRDLWLTYRILGLHADSREELERILTEHIERSLSADNWYPLELESLEFSGLEYLDGQGGDFLAEEILAYMKFGVWTQLDILPEQGKELWKDMEEAAGAGSMTAVYDGQEQNVQQLEQAARKLLECVSEQETCGKEIGAALEDDDVETFEDEAEDFRKAEDRMEDLLEDYEEEAQNLREALQESSRRLEQTKPRMQEGRGQLLEEQMDPYLRYLEAEEERYRQLLEQKDRGARNRELLEKTEEQVEELEAAAEEEEDGDGSLSLDSAVTLWERFESTKLELEEPEADEEKRGFLEQLRLLVQGSLLELVLPDGMEVSDAALPAEGLPSQNPRAETAQSRNPVQQVLIHEYCCRFFHHAGKEGKKPVQYEVEYLLEGGMSDRENLEAAAAQMFLIRQGLNLLHILSDGAKREEARALALLITGAAGLAPLAEIAACFVMVVWAMGEAAVDVKSLLAGKKVPLWKTAQDWNLTLEGLLSMGQEKACPDTETEGRGFSYEGYLKLLLLLEDTQEKQLRMLDVMQMNLQREDPDFQAGQCVYGAWITGRARGKHVFFTLPLVENQIRRQTGYTLQAEAEKRY